MTKYVQDFTIFSGDDKDLIFTVTNASTGAAVDLTGASVVWVLADGPTGASLVKRSTDSGCGISLGSGGVFTVTLVPAHTSGLSGQYYHEAQVRDSASKVSTVSVGTVTIKYDTAQ